VCVFVCVHTCRVRAGVGMPPGVVAADRHAVVEHSGGARRSTWNSHRCMPSCGPSCGQRNVLLEPESEQRRVDWKHVGEGNGQYDVVSKFEYVGEGCGSHMMRPGGRWRLRPCCKVLGLMAAVLVAALVVWYASLAESAVESSGLFDCRTAREISKVKATYCCRNFDIFCNSTEQAETASTSLALPSQFVQPPAGKEVDCSEGFENRERGWSASKKWWCCSKEGLGCEGLSSAPAVSTPARAAPPEPLVPPLPFLPYECDIEDDMSAWSGTKLSWCCKHRGMACERARGA